MQRDDYIVYLQNDKTMKTILTPTDFSENALVATKYAIELAKQTGQAVRLFHSYIKLYSGYDGHTNADKLIALAEEKARKSMEELLAQLQNSYPEVDITGHCRAGYAAESILREIADERPSMIVMGSKGATNAADKLLGSTTYDVISRTPVPILAIPGDTESCALDNIGFFTTYLEADINALLRFRHIFGSDRNLQMIHLYTTAQEPVAEGEKWKRKIQSEFPGEPFSFRTARVTGVNAEVISQIAQKDNFDLLVFTRVHKTLLTKMLSKSLTWDVAKHISTPTLFIHG